MSTLGNTYDPEAVVPQPFCAEGRQAPGNRANRQGLTAVPLVEHDNLRKISKTLNQGDIADQVLAEHFRLVRANKFGRPDAKGDRLYAVLGPVPLPVTLSDGGGTTFEWTTFARVEPGDLGAEPGFDVDIFEEGALEAPGVRKALLKRVSLAKEWPQSILTFGDFTGAQAPLVRIHSNCATGDVFGSQRCECGPQLHSAMAEVARLGCGALVYMADHEGRGIGLFAKAAAYLLQDQGLDTYEANRILGYHADDRDFSDAAFILNHLRGEGRAIKLLSNNPEKRKRLAAVDLPVDSMVPLVTGITRNNLRYLNAKRLYGHILPEDLLGPVAAPKASAH